jgi:hypothetical protein
MVLSKPVRGGVRTNNGYHANSQRVMDAHHLNKTKQTKCACGCNCMQKASEQLDNYDETVKQLRAGRFKGTQQTQYIHEPTHPPFH